MLSTFLKPPKFVFGLLKWKFYTTEGAPPEAAGRTLFLKSVPDLYFQYLLQLQEGKEQSYDQRQNNKRLLAALNQDSEEVLKQIQYYVKFPAIEDHKDHPMGEVGDSE